MTILVGVAALAGLAAAPTAARDLPGRAADRVDARALTAQGCSGDPIEADQVIEGTFGTELRGSYVMVPFAVPRGTTAIRVKYCYDQPENQLPMANHTIDLGLYEPRAGHSGPWGEREFRGWGGSSHPDVVLSPEGFKPVEDYVAKPRSNVPGKTTRGFLPGRIPAGEWAAELGIASVIGRDQGDADARVAWRLEIELSDDPRFADQPYRPALYDDRPARSEPGWYAGDMHVHAEHSALGDATMRETFDYAFGKSPDAAGLDFITLSDYVSGGAWGEIPRFQRDYPGKLVLRSAEVITYRGHLNNHASLRRIDYRTGPVYERRPDGSLRSLRPATPASAAFRRIIEAGGFTQINHPTIFPSSVPLFRAFCRGCPWDYSAAETDYSLVDGLEVSTGPAGLQNPVEVGPNPFTPLAIDFYEKALGGGNEIAAVGVSDSHNAGTPEDALTQSPIGQATTVVRADELSECGISRGIQLGHSYAKLYGPDGPDLRLEAAVPGSGERAILGDTVSAPGDVSFKGQVLNADRTASRGRLLTVLVLRDGGPFRTFTATGDSLDFGFTATAPGRYRLQLMRGTTIEAVSSPIRVRRGEPALVRQAVRPCRAALSLRASARRSVRTRSGRIAVGCLAREGGIARCRVRLRTRRRGRTVTVGSGASGRLSAAPETASRRRVSVRLSRYGRSLLRRQRRLRTTIEARATDGRDRERLARRRMTLRR